jgi:hypothetical protein
MTKGLLAVGLVALAAMPIAARADIITGVLNITGTAEFTSTGVTFLGNEFSINSPAAAQQGGFEALEGTMGTIDNVTNPPDAVGALDVPDFMTFDAAPNISITLTFLDAGIDGAAGCTSTPPAAGQICTPNLPSQSPFNFQNISSTSSILTFGINGVEVDSLTGDTAPITGLFTLPFSTDSFQDLLSTAGGGGSVTTSFAGQFTVVQTSPTPEPGTLIFMLAGFGMLVLVRLLSSRSMATNSDRI